MVSDCAPPARGMDWVALGQRSASDTRQDAPPRGELERRDASRVIPAGAFSGPRHAYRRVPGRHRGCGGPRAQGSGSAHAGTGGLGRAAQEPALHLAAADVGRPAPVQAAGVRAARRQGAEGQHTGHRGHNGPAGFERPGTDRTRTLPGLGDHLAAWNLPVLGRDGLSRAQTQHATTISLLAGSLDLPPESRPPMAVDRLLNREGTTWSQHCRAVASWAAPVVLQWPPLWPWAPALSHPRTPPARQPT